MINQNLVAFSSDKYTYVHVDKTFYADVSELNGGKLEIGQVYDDACDVGFFMVSSKTGFRVAFALSNTMADREGEVNAWQFMSVAESPELRDLKVMIFND